MLIRLDFSEKVADPYSRRIHCGEAVESILLENILSLCRPLKVVVHGFTSRDNTVPDAWMLETKDAILAVVS